MYLSREGLFRFYGTDVTDPDNWLCLGKMIAADTELSGTVTCRGARGHGLGGYSYSFVGSVVEYTSINFTSKTYVEGPNAGWTDNVAEIFEYYPHPRLTDTLATGVFAEVMSFLDPEAVTTNTHAIRLGIDGTIEAIDKSECQTSGALQPASLVKWTGIGDAIITNSNCRESK